MSNKAKIREDAMKLNPIDDTLFCKMAENIAFCEEILQIILNDTCLKVLNERRFKTTEEGVKEMCEIIERNRAEAAMERLIKSMVSLINKNRITIEEGAEEAELPIDEFKKKIHDLGLAITV